MTAMPPSSPVTMMRGLKGDVGRISDDDAGCVVYLMGDGDDGSEVDMQVDDSGTVDGGKNDVGDWHDVFRGDLTPRSGGWGEEGDGLMRSSFARTYHPNSPTS